MNSSYLWCLVLVLILLASPADARIILSTGVTNQSISDILNNSSVQTGPDQALFYTSVCKSCIGSVAIVQEISRQTSCHIPVYDISEPENFTRFQQYQARFPPGSLGMPVLIAGDVAIGGSAEIKQSAPAILTRQVHTRPNPIPATEEPNLADQILMGMMGICILAILILSIYLIYTVVRTPEGRRPRT